MDLKSTLNLPDPNFAIPMKADLSTREPITLAKWNEIDIYRQINVERATAPTFILHDGPPYTNGSIHLGTGLNKVLKDFTIKSRSMMGFRTPFVPGYDNHGLPIEQAVMKKLQAQKIQFDIPTLRQACREHAEHFVGVQTEQFQRMGVFGMWDKPYKSMDYRFEANIVRMFNRLVERQQVYRGLKPVMWSPTSRTALADTEIVYHDHVSQSIYVRFPLIEDLTGWSEGCENVFAIIWTTTPWTIPANLGLAFHPQFDYHVFKANGATYVLLKELFEKVCEKLGFTETEIIRTVKGEIFDHSKFKHPIFERDSLAVLADYVTTEDGTGIVHTAPGHGREDFSTGQRYGLQVLCPVDEKGVMTDEAGEFEGLKYTESEAVIIGRMKELGTLLLHEPYNHTYPYAERDGKPVIFRATEQWFVSMDINDLRAKMLDQIEHVQWVPESGKSRIKAMISGRPDWCISRQRPWGVGIPVFYGAESGEPVLDEVAIEAVAHLVETEGSDAWYTKSAKEILPVGFTHPLTGETEFTKEVDVFDVWFDSASTWSGVLEGNVESEWKEDLPADLYLEGSDQHRGWFNVSLIIGTAVLGHAPFKAVITHGFVTDEQGRKQSKSLGNVVDPLDVCAKNGADVLRYWMASINYFDDMPCGPTLLAVAGDGYRKIRNTLRILHANLQEFDPATTKKVELMDFDRYIVEQTESLCQRVVESYKEYNFRAALSEIQKFCVDQLSAVYVDASKDRMYCDRPEWDSRLSGQWACYQVIVKLVKLIAPILPFTAEEIYERLPIENKKRSIHMEVFEYPDEARINEIAGNELQIRFGELFMFREEMFAAFDPWKQAESVKNSQDVVVFATISEERLSILQTFESNEIANICKMSWVHWEVGEPGFKFEMSPYALCERSRLRRPDVEEVNGVFLSARDRRALGI